MPEVGLQWNCSAKSTVGIFQGGARRKDHCSRVVVLEAQSGCSRRVPDERIIAAELQSQKGSCSGVVVPEAQSGCSMGSARRKDHISAEREIILLGGG